MIYLDNAATTFPKPESVIRAVCNSFSFSANPGRAGHSMSVRASEAVFGCREAAAELFNVDDIEKIILTPSCTVSLNTVIKGILRKGDHVVISSLEHNSVVRPIEKLCASGDISYSVAQVTENNHDATLDAFRKAFRDNTRLAVFTAGSNVFGLRLPVSRICALCRYYGVLSCVDAAQTAGVIPFDMQLTGADFLCCPGHKGLYGPMGTGLLIINCNTIPDSLYEGGTGSGSSQLVQPSILPDKFESGTLNLPGIVGLATGIRFVIKKRTDVIFSHELGLTRMLYDRLSRIGGVMLYTDRPNREHHLPLLSFNIEGLACEDVSRSLDSRYGIAVRAGLHCSPLAHRSFGTDAAGTVRICPSVFTKPQEIDRAAQAVAQIAAGSKKTHF